MAKGETTVTVKEGNGNKQTTISITVSSEVSAPNVPGTDYGAIVNGYDCSSAGVNNWLLFYADDENIYLIADDYIPYENIPSNSKGHKPNKGGSDYPRAAYFTDILDDYEGSASITDPDIKALNNDYFTKGYSSSYNNMKTVAYMMDTNAWSVYAGEHAEYAIGGPSIELFVKSYNEHYGTGYTTSASRYGYMINGKTSIDLSQSEKPYVITDTSNAYGMWLASPSGSSHNAVMYVYYNGNIDKGDSTYIHIGIRPLVCLKSGTKLEKIIQ